jgi:hypothetical protein
MPSRKLTDRCHNCGTKNHLRSRFCNQCGCRLDENRALRDADGRAKLHADIAHPINSMCREKIQAAVLSSYAEELERSKMPGYISRYDEYESDEFELHYDPHAAPPMSAANESPVRRAPLRGHTQHARGGQSAFRGPHPPRGRSRASEGRIRPPSSRRVGRIRQRPLISRHPFGPHSVSSLELHPLLQPGHSFRGIDGSCVRLQPARPDPVRRGSARCAGSVFARGQLLRTGPMSDDPEAVPEHPEPTVKWARDEAAGPFRSAGIMRIARLAALAYLGFLTVLYAFQTRLILPRP